MKKYILSIPTINKGYTVSSEEQFVAIKIQSMFVPEGATVIGRLPSISKSHYVLYAYSADIVIPILEQYDVKSNKVGQHHLFDYSFCNDIEHANQQCTFIVIDSLTIERVNYLSGFEMIVVHRDTLFLGE